MSPGRAAVVTSTDKSMPAAPANSAGRGCSDADAPQLSRMLDVHLGLVPGLTASRVLTKPEPVMTASPLHKLSLTVSYLL